MKNYHKLILILVFFLLLAGCIISNSGNGQPDLVIQYYTVTYDDCPWGGPGQVSVRVQNVGEGDAGEFVTEINGSETAVIPPLPAGNNTDAVVAFTAGPIGGVQAEADVKQQVAESNEDNNTYEIVFTPPPPCTTPTP